MSLPGAPDDISREYFENVEGSYADFLSRKAIVDPSTGLRSIPKLNPKLFGFQRDIVKWALRRGRAAIFADCGAGKSPMQLEWARCIPGKVLILAPLAVAQQTVREGEKFGIPCEYLRATTDTIGKITITNYEMMQHFDASKFNGIVLDESSILKAQDGKTRAAIIETFSRTPYRLACTATPAPNDYMELGNHSEFLGVMNRMEMLAMFFVHDGGSTQKWRLKGHAESEFWRWLCSWAVTLRKPSDLGYADGAFKLPPLKYHSHVVESIAPEGFLFPVPADTLQERIRARSSSTEDRAHRCADLVNASTERWIVWCGLNKESALISRLVGDDAVEVCGSDSIDYKEQSLWDFARGKIRVLVSKASIAGHGMNFQKCRNVAFLGLSDSWETYYQAVRRCWRFGQKRPVHVHVITAQTEGAVVSNIQRKETDAARMAESMVEHMSDITKRKLRGTSRDKAVYVRDLSEGSNWAMHLGDCVEVCRELEDGSIGFTVFSPPFSSLYTYSNSDRDMGNCTGDDQFHEHFRFLVRELYRLTAPGRLVSIHCMDLPTSKVAHGVIGLRDFRGDIIRAMAAEGFIFHSNVTIWKDPVTAMQRTKALGLLWRQLKKDSAMSRQGIPDYLCTFRKPGENSNPVSHTDESFPVERWQRWASPVWTDINPSDTLQHRSAREEKDERHIAPLQLEVIKRAIALWSNPGDLVLSPFAGIGSEGYVALRNGRRFVGIELKRSYWKQAVANLWTAKDETLPLFAGPSLLPDPPVRRARKK